VDLSIDERARRGIGLAFQQPPAGRGVSLSALGDGQGINLNLRRFDMRLGELIKTGVQEGKEKHVPVIELIDGGVAVKITVGKEVSHPNTVEHHIKWIALFGVKNGVAVHIGTFDLSPTYGVPTVVASVDLEGLSELIAVEYCNLHGLWESSLTL